MFRSLRLSTKLMLTIVPMLVIAISVSAYLNIHFQEQEMLSQARASAQTYSDLIRESLVDMMVTREQVDDGYLARLNAFTEIHDLHIHFTTANLRLREVFRDSSRFARLSRREQSVQALPPEQQAVFQTGEPFWQRSDSTFNAVVPFRATPKCQQCHAVRVGQVLGAADMRISLTRMAGAIRNNWIRSIWIAYLFAALAIFVSVLIYWGFVAKPLRELLEATKRIGGGDLDRPIAAGHSRDELGELRSSFERMRVRLKEAQDKVIHSERLSMIGQMASSIIHDFRTPMSTINLAVESLQERREVPPEKTEEWYRMIRDSVQRMITMAQELLDFSRGEVRLNKAEYRIDEFMATIVRSIKSGLERSRVILLVEGTPDGFARFDPDRLHRALVNIINNAQDAMPKGGELHLRAGRENGSILFSITDTGVGIPAEIREKIFDAFVTAGKKKGTGLGLAITKRIIDQHGGSIEVESEVGKGTTFRVRIPE